jgi:hypothetical protein
MLEIECRVAPGTGIRQLSWIRKGNPAAGSIAITTLFELAINPSLRDDRPLSFLWGRLWLFRNVHEQLFTQSSKTIPVPRQQAGTLVMV